MGPTVYMGDETENGRTEMRRDGLTTRPLAVRSQLWKGWGRTAVSMVKSEIQWGSAAHDAIFSGVQWGTSPMRERAA